VKVVLVVVIVWGMPALEEIARKKLMFMDLCIVI